MTTQSYASGPTDRPLLDLTIGESLANAVNMWPDQEALVVRHQNIRWTYDELATRVERLSRSLVGLGFRPGDRLGIWSPNHAEWVLTQFATAKIGVILVCINPAYQTHEAKYVLEHSGCRGLVAATSFKASNYVSMLEEMQTDLPSLQHVAFIGTESWKKWAESEASIDADIYEEIIATLQPTDPINIQYTSGTTGFPKGATLTHRNILNNGYFVGQGCGYTQSDRICVPVPFYHCFGMVMGNLAALTHGATVVVPGPSFAPIQTLESIVEEGCTSLYGVPTMFIAQLAELHNKEYEITTLRTGIMAGSPCPIEVMKQCMEGMNISEVTIAYGMTETSPVSTQTAIDDPVEKRVSTVGQVHPHVEICIVDPHTREAVPRGTTGEFCTRGYSVMHGYWEDPQRTADAIDQEGWMHTGDLAVMDEEGYVSIVGRIKDMVIRGGENIYPREVEEFLYQHPNIHNVQVIGVPDPTYGEALMAWVQMEKGSSLTIEELRAFCKGKIAHFKIPTYLESIDTFPTTVTGKIQKYRLREMAIERLEQAAD